MPIKRSTRNGSDRNGLGNTECCNGLDVLFITVSCLSGYLKRSYPVDDGEYPVLMKLSTDNQVFFGNGNQITS